GGGLTPKVLVRSSRPGAAQAVEAVVVHIDSRIRTETTPLQDNFHRWGAGFRVSVEMAGVLGLVALVLAAIGIAGGFASLVEGRTKEIGIRMALGATRTGVVALVLGSASRAVASGLFVGYIAAAGLARLMRGFLVGVSPFDPGAYLAVGFILTLAG